MGRSVSYPSGYSTVTFKQWFQPELEEGEEYRDPESWDWDYFVEDLQEYAPTLWPSLSKCDEWIGREDHALLENNHCYMGISEYCGLASIWIVPKVDDWTGEPSGLAAQWCAQIADKFVSTFGELSKVASMSNGEGVYHRITKDTA